MVNWNSKAAKIGDKIQITLEVTNVVSEGGSLTITATPVDLPVGVSAGNVILGAIPNNEEDKGSTKVKK